MAGVCPRLADSQSEIRSSSQAFFVGLRTEAFKELLSSYSLGLCKAGVLTLVPSL